ncbi:MAG: DNA cytosine methyltransferase [Comamonas sp.]|nr:DNA cytosine methyltransferase [Comamonas sp.]
MRAIDLFAGAGGFSTGAAMAGVEVVWAANHWQLAVKYHAVNHPAADHLCQDLHQADYSEVPAAEIMLAAPCCQGHSKARGKAKGPATRCKPQHRLGGCQRRRMPQATRHRDRERARVPAVDAVSGLGAGNAETGLLAVTTHRGCSGSRCATAPRAHVHHCHQKPRTAGAGPAEAHAHTGQRLPGL